MSPHGRYWYRHGVNRNAVIALILAAVIAVSSAMLPALSGLANFSWFIGMFFGAFFYFLLARRRISA
jgi:NCS1 family nucleobase:cation symporter-1